MHTNACLPRESMPRRPVVPLSKRSAVPPRRGLDLVGGLDPNLRDLPGSRRRADRIIVRHSQPGHRVASICLSFKFTPLIQKSVYQIYECGDGW